MLVRRIKSICLSCVITCLGVFNLSGQVQTVGIFNPSFEDIPQHSKPPIGWFYCGQVGESPPDVHPTGMFNVEQDPFEGRTYVGMVTRDNNTWEGLGQRLESPMKAGQCYTFSLYACRSTTYTSYSKSTGQPAEYTEPVVLRIWGGQHNCDGKELLGVSKKIVTPEWEVIQFQFQANDNYTHFFIETYYNNEGNKTAYNGNVLIDNASPIVPIDCETSEWLVDVNLIQEVKYPEDLSKEGLIETIQVEGPQIAFDDYDQLEKQLIKIDSHTLRFTNKALWKIATALKARPGSKLLIVVKGDNPYAIEQRKSNIRALFDYLNIYPSNYKIKAFKPAYTKKTWLWQEETALLMNLLR